MRSCAAECNHRAVGRRWGRHSDEVAVDVGTPVGRGIGFPQAATGDRQALGSGPLEAILEHAVAEDPEQGGL